MAGRSLAVPATKEAASPSSLSCSGLTSDENQDAADASSKRHVDDVRIALRGDAGRNDFAPRRHPPLRSVVNAIHFCLPTRPPLAILPSLTRKVTTGFDKSGHSRLAWTARLRGEMPLHVIKGKVCQIANI
jgi:hypothetical protein